MTSNQIFVVQVVFKDKSHLVTLWIEAGESVFAALKDGGDGFFLAVIDPVESLTRMPIDRFFIGSDEDVLFVITE